MLRFKANPLHTGEQQTVIKSGYTDKVYTNITVEYQQFWLIGKHWLKFLDFKTSACEEHPVICSTKPKKIFTQDRSAIHVWNPRDNTPIILIPHFYQPERNRRNLIIFTEIEISDPQ